MVMEQSVAGPNPFGGQLGPQCMGEIGEKANIRSVLQRHLTALGGIIFTSTTN